MTPELIVIIATSLFLVLLVVETPIAFALATSGAVGIALLGSVQLATATLGTTPYSAVSSYSLAIIPMYILLGMFALHGRLAERVYSVGARALRFLPGGLGIATVAACAGFAAVSGSSVATAASIGKISVTQMRNNGYNVGFAAGIVAVGGTLGILIPPSVALVMYGIIAGESIAQLLAAGILPGILLALSFCVFIALMSRRMITPPQQTLSAALGDASGGAERRLGRNSLSQEVSGAGSSTVLKTHTKSNDPVDESLPNEKVTTGQGTRAVLWLALIFAVIMVGMFSGTFTVIESAAIGALVALAMLISENVRKGVRDLVGRFLGAIKEAAAVSSMIFALLFGATVFSTFLVMSRVPIKLADAVGGLQVPSIVVVVVILLLLIPLGMFLEALSILIIVVPLVHPIISELGYDGVWFGILFVIMLEIGLITPPVGMNVFVVASSAGVPVEKVFRGVSPFLIPAFVTIVLIMMFPDIVLWLPSLVVN